MTVWVGYDTKLPWQDPYAAMCQVYDIINCLSSLHFALFMYEMKNH